MPILADKIEIKIEGKKIENYKFSNITLVQELQKPNELTFCLHKDDLTQDEKAIRYSLTEQLLGKKVELTMNTVRENKNKKLENDTLTFSGTIFNVNILKKNLLAGAIIEVTAYSPDYLLFDHPHCISYENTKLKDIVTKTITPFDIEISNNPAQQEEIPYTVQYNESNYGFLRRLSSRYGEWFYYNGEKLVFGKIEKKDAVTLTLGNDMNDYHYRLNMEHLHFSHAHHNYLDYGNKATSFDAPDESLHYLTDIACDNSKTLYEKETFQHLRSSAPEASFDETEISAKVQGLGEKAQMLICDISSIRADLRIGSVIKIEEEFQKENGDKTQYEHDELVIYKLIHVSDGVSSYENRFTAIPAACEYPPYTYGDHYPKAGTQRAVVTDNKDPEALGRVRVQFLWQKEQDEELITPWIRIAQPHGGKDKGFYFIPEIGEEVMVGFENGNAEKPYVIGTLFHGEQQPIVPEAYVDKNGLKYIRSRHNTIAFYDDPESDCGMIQLNNKNCSLSINSSLEYIQLKTTGNIILEADGDITLDAKGNVKINAGGDVSIGAGGSIDETADNNVQIGAGENMTMNAGNNMDTNVGSNDTLYVSGNQTIEINSNKQETISGDYEITATDIREEATGTLQLYGKKIEERGDSSVKLDGGSSLDLYAGNIRIN